MPEIEETASSEVPAQENTQEAEKRRSPKLYAMVKSSNETALHEFANKKELNDHFTNNPEDMLLALIRGQKLEVKTATSFDF